MNKNDFKQLRRILRQNYQFSEQYATMQYFLETYKHWKKTGEIKPSDRLEKLNTGKYTTEEGEYIPEIKETIKQYYEELRKRTENIGDIRSLEKQEYEEQQINNIYTINEWNEKNPNKKITKERGTTEERGTYIPSQKLDLHNLHTLFNKEDNIKWERNPTLKHIEKINIAELHQYIGQTINTTFTIKQLVGLKGTPFQRMETKYRFMCPRCKEQFTMLPIELGQQTIEHECLGYMTETGRQLSVKIGKEVREPIEARNMFLYEVTQKARESIYIYSTENNIEPGTYNGDIYVTINRMKHGDKLETILLLLGYKELKPNTEGKELYKSDHKKAKNWCEKNNLPHIKILDVMYSIRDIYNEYTKDKIDNRGTFLQLAITISGVAKLLFKYRKLGVSVMANMSAGKTYPATRFAMMLDKRYKFSQNSEDVSPAGLKGGINTAKNINGSVTRVFEPGAVTTAGFYVMDEGANFYKDPIMNNALKAFPEKVISIDKIGGEQHEQNYTIIILCNFTEHDRKYRDEIKDVYKTLLKREGRFKTEQEIEVKLQPVNFYLPLEYYYDDLGEEALGNAIGYVRDKYTNKNVDWRTGGRIEASYRLLFDVVVWNQIEYAETQEDYQTEYSKLNTPSFEDIPRDEFIEQLQQNYISRDGKILELFEEHKNTQEVQDQLSLLKNSIQHWLKHEGIHVLEYLSEGKKRIDSKLESLVYTTALILQLYEDPNSTTLYENVKKWLEVILLKCKRGLSVDEYDFIKNRTVIKLYRVNFSEIDVNLKEYEKEKDAERVAKALKKQEETSEQEEPLEELFDEEFDISDLE